MAYQTNWEPAYDDLRALEPEIRKRIIKKLGSIVKNPLRFVEKLTDYPFFKLRIGDYRAILDIKQKEQQIVVILIAHRSKIYKELRRK